MNQEIDNSTTIVEIIWRFSRYPRNSAVTLRQNPHFYLKLSEDAASFDSKFHKEPLKDFAHGLRQGDVIHVLLDKACRLFLDSAKPQIFSNLWKPHQTIILKDIGGILESEDTVLRSIGESQDYWYRPSITDSSQHRVGLGYSGADSDIINTPFANARDVIHAAVRAQGVDLMIRDRYRPLPPEDSGWKLLPSPEPSVRVRASEDQTTPRQSATRLPQLEYSNPKYSSPGTGGSTHFTTSTESFRTALAVDTPDASPRPATSVGKLADSGIILMKPPTNTLSTPPPSAPPASLTIPSPLPDPDRELLSAPPVRKWEAPKNWFQKYNIRLRLRKLEAP
ncbi:hypothetical protein H4582DRAFT_704819 [Lactarius indigo]|nr:hypothetical protein H4582DRAFT_704819 [Lactarius indigo]